MIGGYESHTVHLKGGGNNAPDALVNGFDGLDCSVEYTGVADHVAVGEIENDHVILSAFDSLANGVANGICAHFRLKVEGGHIGVGMRILSSPSNLTSSPPLKKKVTWAYFVVSAIRSWVSPAFETVSHGHLKLLGSKGNL